MSKLSESVTRDAAASLTEFLQYSLADFERASDQALRDAMVGSLTATYEAIEGLLQKSITLRDSETFLSVDRAWQDAAEDPTWLWEDEEPEPIPLLQLSRLRAVGHLGLAMWALHSVRTGPDDGARDPLQAILLSLNAHYESVDLLFLALGWAIATDQRPDSNWTNWYLSEKFERGIPQAHFIPAVEDVLRVSILFAVLKTSDPEPVKPRAWMRGRGDEIDALLSSVLQESTTWASLLPDSRRTVASPSVAGHSDEFRRRVEWLRASLKEALKAIEISDDQATRNAHPSVARERELIQEIQRRYDNGRPLRPVLARRNAVATHQGEPPADVTQRLVFFVSKDLLADRGAGLGVDFVAADIARQLAVSEVEQFLRALPSGESAELGGELNEAIRRLLEQARLDGFAPDLVLGPPTWEFKSKAGITALSDEDREELASAPISGVIGRIDSAFVFANPSVGDEIMLVDTARAIRWEEWPGSDETNLDVDVEFLDGEASRVEAARLYPQARAPEVEAAARELEAQAAVRVRPRFRLSAGEGQAITRTAYAPRSSVS